MKAVEYGADSQQIAEAIEVGKRVRQGAAEKMDKFAISLKTVAASPANSPVGECGCSSQDTSTEGNNG